MYVWLRMSALGVTRYPPFVSDIGDLAFRATHLYLSLFSSVLLCHVLYGYDFLPFVSDIGVIPFVAVRS